MIHKALRGGVLSLDIDAGRIDWCDPVQVQGFKRRWDRVMTLVRSHAGHEERHVWPLLERKQPGAVAELGVGHDPIACRAALMAEIPSDEASWTFELILQSCTVQEQRPVVEGLRSSMPEPVFAEWLASVERTVPADDFQQLRRLLDEPVPAG